MKHQKVETRRPRKKGERSPLRKAEKNPRKKAEKNPLRKGEKKSPMREEKTPLTKVGKAKKTEGKIKQKELSDLGAHDKHIWEAIIPAIAETHRVYKELGAAQAAHHATQAALEAKVGLSAVWLALAPQQGESSHGTHAKRKGGASIHTSANPNLRVV